MPFLLLLLVISFSFPPYYLSFLLFSFSSLKPYLLLYHSPPQGTVAFPNGFQNRDYHVELVMAAHRTIFCFFDLPFKIIGLVIFLLCLQALICLKIWIIWTLKKKKKNNPSDKQMEAGNIEFRVKCASPTPFPQTSWYLI